MRPCPRCGKTVKDLATTCKFCLQPIPIAGAPDPAAPVVTLPTAAGMKRCAYCAEEILLEAVVCKHCGLDSRGLRPGAGSGGRSWSPGVAAVLSFFIPGLGQIYKGRIGAGLCWLIGTIAGYVLFIVPGVVIHIICLVNAYSAPAPADRPPARAGS